MTTPRTSRNHAHVTDDELGILAGLEWIRQRLPYLLGIPFGVAFVTAIVVMLIPSRYTSMTTIVPEARSARLPGGLSGIAGQLGLSLPGDAGQSPQFYAQAATSRVLLSTLLNTRFNEGAPPGKPLLDWVRASGRDSGQRMEDGLRIMRDRVTTATNTKTGTVAISFESPSATLSKSVLDSLLAELNHLNVTTRRSQASEKRKFLKERQESAWGELLAAEQLLKQFYEANRQWEQSPGLRVREGQLKRRVDASEQVYTTLAREFEMARVQEFDDIPVFSVVDPPYVPARRSFPRRVVWVIFAAAGAFAVTFVALAVIDYLATRGVSLLPASLQRRERGGPVLT